MTLNISLRFISITSSELEFEAATRLSGYYLALWFLCKETSLDIVNNSIYFIYLILIYRFNINLVNQKKLICNLKEASELKGRGNYID